MEGLLERLWGSGFLPSSHQGVKLRSGGDPVLYLNDPPGVSRQLRRSMLDGLAGLHTLQRERNGDPEIASRVAQYEMTFRMQASVPELTDLSGGWWSGACGSCSSTTADGTSTTI